MTTLKPVASSAPVHHRPTHATMERLIGADTKRLAILIDTEGGLPLEAFDQAIEATWEVTRERGIRVWALWHTPDTTGRMVGAEEADVEHLQMALGEQVGAGSGWRSKRLCTGCTFEAPTATRP